MSLFSQWLKRLSPNANRIDSAPIPPHIESQRERGAPFYCGTVFCGHSTINAAAQCWQEKCDAVRRVRATVRTLHESGKSQEAYEVENAELSRLYPEKNPINWPINGKFYTLDRRAWASRKPTAPQIPQKRQK